VPITPTLQVVTWCVLLSSLSILWLSGLFSPMLIAAGYAAVAVSAVRVRLGAKSWLSPGVWRWLTLGALTLFLLEWVVWDDNLLEASLHLLLYLMIYKLLTLERSRDYLHLYLIGFFQLLASTATTAELPYGVAFFCYVVLAPWTLMLYTLQLEAEQRANPFIAGDSEATGGAAAQLAVIRWPFFVMTTTAALGTFILTLVIFFLIPRMGSGFMQSGGSPSGMLVGFSERVELGEIGAIKLDPTIVMRVGVASPSILPPSASYWRGTAYDFYDGVSWQKRMGSRVNLLRGADGWFRLPPRRRVQAVALPVRQEVILEPLETAVLFAAAEPVAVGGALGSLRIDSQSTLLLANMPAGRIRYQVDSVPPRLSEADRKAVVDDYGRVPTAYVQLPVGSERLVALTRSVVGLPVGGGLSAARLENGQIPIFEAANRIERYLKQNYRYTLDVKPPKELSPIDDFLFEQKAGYCEYYATAMVLMLRSLGVPARLVSGFLPGEWNAFGHYFTVREQEAHTWVEVYFPATGWYPFDPTPSVDESPMMMGRLRQLIDTLWVSWDRYIVRFSIQDQVAAWQEMRSQGTVLQGRSLQWIESAKTDLKLAVAWLVHRRNSWLWLAAAAGFCVLVMRWWAQRHGGWPFWHTQALRATQRSGRTFYTKMLRLLAERGVQKPPALTALEFVAVVGPELGPVALAVDRLTEYYQRLRFGATPLTPDERIDVTRLLRQIKVATAESRRQALPSEEQP
jgi:transglutaminase-like putative cysteine protease